MAVSGDFGERSNGERVAAFAPGMAARMIRFGLQGRNGLVKDGRDEREERLAAQLRANLARRKAQSKTREATFRNEPLGKAFRNGTVGLRETEGPEDGSAA